MTVASRSRTVAAMRGRRCTIAIAMAAALGSAAVATPAPGEIPSVVRARYGAEQGLARGTVFFLETAAGPVAVGAAHSFEVSKLAASPELVFELGRTRARVAAASRLLTLPGVAFSESGGSLRSDFVVFALDAPPASVRVLPAGTARKRGRVAVLGIPGSVPADQDAVGGDVRESNDEKLEIELDSAYDLRGWGGAPVVSSDDGSAIGIVQAAQPTGKTMLVIATPIAAVLDALRTPLEGGRGRVFAALREQPPIAATTASTAPATSPTAPAAAEKQKAPAPIRQTGPQRPVVLAIEYPQNEATFGGAEPTAFVAGRALVPRSEGVTTDVVFVIDVSGSTSAPSGADVNGNGVIGVAPTGTAGGLFALGASDPGDSILAAEVAAVRRLLSRLDPRYTRVALATFSGQMLDYGVLAENPAVTEVALTNAYEDMQRALDRVLARGPNGATYIAAGIDQATNELLGQSGAFSRADANSQKVIVFLTDGLATLPFESDDPRNTITVMRAADRAHNANARVLSFGVGEEALSGPLALLELARLTDGTFTPVRDPALLSEVFAEVEFSDVKTLLVRNATLGAAALATELGADGSFGALVPLRTGRNEIEVTASASDGRSTTERVTVHFAPDGVVAELPPGLVSIQNKLLELRLTQIRRERIAGEQQRVDQLREQLAREIERERERARQRATQQRKQLELEVERQPPSDDGAGSGSQRAPARP